MLFRYMKKLQSWSWYFETFSYFNKCSSHDKGKEASILVMNFVYLSYHKLPNDLRLRSLVYYKILGKSKKFIELYPST